LERPAILYGESAGLFLWCDDEIMNNQPMKGSVDEAAGAGRLNQAPPLSRRQKSLLPPFDKGGMEGGHGLKRQDDHG